MALHCSADATSTTVLSFAISRRCPSEQERGNDVVTRSIRCRALNVEMRFLAQTHALQAQRRVPFSKMAGVVDHL